MGAKGKGKGKIKAGKKKNKSLVKVFYPVNSSGFPAERRKRVNLLHPEVLRGSGWQRLKSPNFWQSSPAPRASCSNPAPQIGPGWCYCWRRQNKSPRSLLEKREIKSLNSLGEKKKKKSVENKLDNGESNSAPFLSLVPSPRFPQLSVHKHILWPGLFMCCQGDGADSCRAAPLGQQRPAGHGVDSESTAAAVPCSAPDLQLPAAKGPAGGTGIWAEFQAIAPLGTCCFFFVTLVQTMARKRSKAGPSTREATAPAGTGKDSRSRRD